MSIFGLFSSKKTPTASQSSSNPSDQEDKDALPPYLFEGVLDDDMRKVSAICNNVEKLATMAPGLLELLNKYCTDHHGHANTHRKKLVKITQVLAPHAGTKEFLAFIGNVQHDLAWEMITHNHTFTVTPEELELVRNPPRPSRLHSNDTYNLAKLRRTVTPSP